MTESNLLVVHGEVALDFSSRVLEPDCGSPLAGNHLYILQGVKVIHQNPG